jgi:ring-1,2-phenylacetyl-CoA epoxidase subunit PaaB
VVESNYVHANDPADSDEFFEPSDTKIYRHPTFYEVPDGVKHM